MKDQRPDKQVESSITGGACSARSQFHKAPVYIMEEGSAVPAGLRATQIKCTSCKIQRDPRARARANGSESHFRFLKTSTHRTFPLQLLPAAPLPSPRPSAPARHEIRSGPIANEAHNAIPFPSLEELAQELSRNIRIWRSSIIFSSIAKEKWYRGIRRRFYLSLRVNSILRLYYRVPPPHFTKIFIKDSMEIIEGRGEVH